MLYAMPKAPAKRRTTEKRTRRRVLIVTGSRSEFGLLRPVMDAVKKHRKLELLVVVAGEHLLKPVLTVREVEKAYPVAARVPMQRGSDHDRADHAAATARGMQGFAAAFKTLRPDWVVVLGDRIEAFAAASAASIAGIAVCHIHGGDRAEGIADEAMRHAITKLSHLHCAATILSAERIVKMGERPEHVHVTGSPAIDGLKKVAPMTDAEAKRLGNPTAVILLHPNSAQDNDQWAHKALLKAMEVTGSVKTWHIPTMFSNVLCMCPNSDPGKSSIQEVWNFASVYGATVVDHLPRATFLSLLKRLAHRGGAIIGNSSAGLIEAAAIGLPAINLGPRQAGRERAANVLDIPSLGFGKGVLQARQIRSLLGRSHQSSRVFGDGRSGPRIAALLVQTDPHDPALTRKRNSY